MSRLEIAVSPSESIKANHSPFCAYAVAHYTSVDFNLYRDPWNDIVSCRKTMNAGGKWVENIVCYLHEIKQKRCNKFFSSSIVSWDTSTTGSYFSQRVNSWPATEARVLTSSPIHLLRGKAIPSRGSILRRTMDERKKNYIFFVRLRRNKHVVYNFILSRIYNFMTYS